MIDVALCVACAVCVGVLLATEARGGPGARIAAKAASSSCFVALALLRFDGSAQDIWILGALLAGAAGDMLLASESTFDVGLLAFLADHILLVGAVITVLPPSRWSLIPVLPLALLAVVVLRWLWAHLHRRRLPVTVYVIAILFMVWGALGAAVAGVWPWWTAAAAVLFMLSDLTVARHRFVQAAFVNRLFGLPMYYSAQLLFALLIGT